MNKFILLLSTVLACTLSACENSSDLPNDYNEYGYSGGAASPGTVGNPLWRFRGAIEKIQISFFHRYSTAVVHTATGFYVYDRSKLDRTIAWEITFNHLQMVVESEVIDSDLYEAYGALCTQPSIYEVMHQTCYLKLIEGFLALDIALQTNESSAQPGYELIFKTLNLTLNQEGDQIHHQTQGDDATLSSIFGLNGR